MKAGSSGGVEGIKGPDAATGLSQVCTESGIRCPRHVASLLYLLCVGQLQVAAGRAVMRQQLRSCLEAPAGHRPYGQCRGCGRCCVVVQVGVLSPVGKLMLSAAADMLVMPAQGWVCCWHCVVVPVGCIVGTLLLFIHRAGLFLMYSSAVVGPASAWPCADL